MAEIPGWIAGLLAVLITIGGGSTTASIGRTAIQTQQVAQTAAESIAQNGCYTTSTEAVLQSALQKAGMDPAKVALSATTTKQGYGQAVDVRVEYVREFNLLGWETPWVWRAAAESPDVSTNVAPVQNQPCKAPIFAATTGQSGFESANSPAMLAMNSGRDFTTLAASANSCTKPVQKTRTLTKYRDETYQEQTGTRQETRYRDETYQEAVQKTRTVTKYRDETRYRTETVTQEVRGVDAGYVGSSFSSGAFTYYGNRGSGRPLVNTWYGYALEGWFQPCSTNRTAWGSTYYNCPDAIDQNYPDTITVRAGDMVRIVAREWRDYNYYGRRETGWSHRINFGSTSLVYPAASSAGTRLQYYLTYYGGYWVGLHNYSFTVSPYVTPGIYYVEIVGGWTGIKLPLKIIVNGTMNVTRQVPYTVQVPYEATETYTEMVTKTRQVPYTVNVPVYEQRTRRVPYQEQETYTVYVPCST